MSKNIIMYSKNYPQIKKPKLIGIFRTLIESLPIFSSYLMGDSIVSWSWEWLRQAKRHMQFIFSTQIPIHHQLLLFGVNHIFTYVHLHYPFKTHTLLFILVFPLRFLLFLRCSTVLYSCIFLYIPLSETVINF